MRSLTTFFTGFDVLLFFATTALSLLGLVTMYSHLPGGHSLFSKQIVWIGISLFAMLVAVIPDYRFLRTGNAAVMIYVTTLALLALILVIGQVTLGAQSRFNLGIFSIQPSDPAKLVLIITLAKYFSKRHVEIVDIRHIVISGVYAFLMFAFIFVQPDFGSAIIIFLVWFGLILVAGISWKHLFLVFFLGTVAFNGLWFFGFHEYQKQRILTFLHPLADIRGTGYNAYQSTIAVGSGQLMGKGVGYGTQSKLQFLPEYETDFIFAAYAEEWGFVGVLLLFALYGLLITRIIVIAQQSASNFERLFGAGVAILFIAHFVVHIGMNIGLLPVTGTTVPFLSYGGSHLVTEFLAVGMLMGMSKRRTTTSNLEKSELIGAS